MISVTVISCFEDLSELALEIRRIAPTPFHLPEWQSAWWQHFGSGNLLAIACCESHKLQAFFAGFVHEWQGARQLTLLGSGISDYIEPILTPSCVSPLMERVEEVNWQICNWQDLPSDSQLLNRQLWRNKSVEIESDVPTSSIAVEGSFAAYIQNRSKDLRRNLRRYRDRAEQTAPLRFRVLEAADPEVMDALINLHAARWQKRGEAGTIEQNKAADFLRDVGSAMSEAGVLRIFELRWGEAVAAISLGFLWRQRLYSYLSAFRPEQEILGFGRILLYEALAYAWEQRYTAWDFLRGEEPYKRSWGAVAESRSRLIVRR